MARAKNMVLQDLVWESTVRHTSEEAVCFRDGDTVKTITYHQLRQGSMAIQQEFARLKISGIVAILLEADIRIPAVLMGLLSNDCSFHPMDPSGSRFSVEALVRMDVSFVVTHQRFIPVLKELSREELQSPLFSKFNLHIFHLNLKVVRRIEDFAIPSPARGFKEDDGVIPEKLVYCITTSGTTSSPKIVKVFHSSIVPNVIQLRELFQFAPGDRILLTSPLTFDPSVIDIFCTLTSGACLVIVPDQVKMAPEILLGVLHGERPVTAMQATPALMRRFPAAKLRQTLLGPVSNLRILALGGETFPSVSELKRWVHPENRTTFFNLYGITELSCWATFCRVDILSVIETNKEVSIGNPLNETVVKLVSFPGLDTEEDTASDEDASRIGEIWIGSSTRTCLVEESGGNDGERSIEKTVWRKTGDVGKRLTDGHIICLGRQDDQIKRHGKRLNISVIELVLREVPEVLDCSVLTHGDDILVAFVVLELSLESEWSHMEEKLRTHCRLSLPGHYLPDRFIHLEENLPITRHGKVDKKRLLLLFDVASHKGECQDFGASRNLVLKLWRTHIPGLDSDVKDTDNFLLVGGDSLSAVRICSLFDPEYFNSLLDVILGKTFLDFLHALEELKCREQVGNSPQLVADTLTEDNNIPTTFLDSEQSAEDNDIGRSVRLKSGDKRNAANLSESGRTQHKRKRVIMSLENSGSSGNMSALKTTASSEHENSTEFPIMPKTYSAPSVNSPVLLATSFPDDPKIEYSNPLRQMVQFVCRGGRVIKNAKHFNHGHATCGENPSQDIASCEKLSRDQKVRVDKSEFTVEDQQRRQICVVKDGKTLSLTAKWKHSTGKCVDASPLVVEFWNKTMVYIGSHSGQFCALDLKNGGCLWMTPLPDRIEGSACCSQDGTLIVVGCYDSHIYVLCSMTGNIVWRFKTGDAVKCTPILDLLSSHVICGSHDGHVYFLDILCKKCVWQRHLGGASVFSSPAVSAPSSLIYVASLAGRVFALSQMNGAIVWCVDLKKPVFASLLCHENHVLVACVDGRICQLQGNSGLQEWSFQTSGPIFSSPVASDDTILCGSHDCSLYCLSASTGKLLWRVETSSTVYATCFPFDVSWEGHTEDRPKDEGFEKTGIHDNTEGRCSYDTKHPRRPKMFKSSLLVTVSTDGTIDVLAAKSGQRVAGIQMSEEIFSSPVVAANSIIVGCRDDFVYCFEIT